MKTEFIKNNHFSQFAVFSSINIIGIWVSFNGRVEFFNDSLI